jgi:hypothetical protein
VYTKEIREALKAKTLLEILENPNEILERLEILDESHETLDERIETLTTLETIGSLLRRTVTPKGNIKRPGLTRDRKPRIHARAVGQHIATRLREDQRWIKRTAPSKSTQTGTKRMSLSRRVKLQDKCERITSPEWTEMGNHTSQGK